jgi:RHS repeat-associated protein
MREQRTPENDIYRYGYQGNFSEHDEETNWNHFELRQNDPIVGRWTTRDPKNAGFSPYWSMDNNPIIKTDPDGGCPGGCPGFWFRNAMGIKMNKSYGISIGMGLRSPKLDQLFGEFDRYNEKLGPLSINIGAEEFHGRVYLMNDHVAFEGNLFNADLGSYSFRGGDAYLRFDSQGFRNSDVNLFSLTTPTFEGVAYGEHIDRSLDVNIDAGPVDIGVKGPGLWKGFVQWIKNMVNEVITIDGPTLSRDE